MCEVRLRARSVVASLLLRLLASVNARPKAFALKLLVFAACLSRMLARTVVAAATRARWMLASVVFAFADAATRSWRLAVTCCVVVSLAAGALDDTFLRLVRSHRADCIVDAYRTFVEVAGARASAVERSHRSPRCLEFEVDFQRG